jgi:hypothetical protein
MRLTERSGVRQVAAAVSGALASADIRAVLTGGGCASIYTDGTYKSVDLDYVLQSAVTQSRLDEAMTKAGFGRKSNQYCHDFAPLYVEFPPGPLGIGSDYRIVPIELKILGTVVVALSATDSCRDRLAAFLHWRDQQSLNTAVQIALRREVDMAHIRSWCASEGVPEGFDEFVRNLEIAQERRKKPPAPR